MYGTPSNEIVLSENHGDITIFVFNSKLPDKLRIIATIFIFYSTTTNVLSISRKFSININ